jgi:alpha-amylase/alpha-mannosidase (GH57 family)
MKHGQVGCMFAQTLNLHELNAVVVDHQITAAQRCIILCIVLMHSAQPEFQGVTYSHSLSSLIPTDCDSIHLHPQKHTQCAGPIDHVMPDIAGTELGHSLVPQ